MSNKTASHAPPTDAEIAMLVRAFRDMRQWSQDTLAAISKLSVRTIQRVESGLGCDRNTRRALCGAFEFEDLDFFDRAHATPTPEELQAAKEKFERDHVVLDAAEAVAGRDLADVFAGSMMDMSNPAAQLCEAAQRSFAMLVDYLRDYRDMAAELREVEKLDIHAELQALIDEVRAAGGTVFYAVRMTTLMSDHWENKIPLPAKIVYLAAYPNGTPLGKMAVPKAINIAW